MAHLMGGQTGLATGWEMQLPWGSVVMQLPFQWGCKEIGS